MSITVVQYNDEKLGLSPVIRFIHVYIQHMHVR